MTTQAEDQLRGALAAQDKRILDAGQRVGMYFGTDTPERMADEIEELRATNERLTAAASGRGMVSEMDGLPEIAVLVVGLHERAERAEAEEIRQLGMRYMVDLASMTARAERAEAALERAALEIAFLESALDTAENHLKAEEKFNAENEAMLSKNKAALEQARALAEKWADMKYNGDLTTAVYHGCAEELAAVLASGGAA